MARVVTLLINCVLLAFSCWLMWHTFSYNSSRQVLVISDKVWSDFGALIPLTRSFSHGFNWPVEHPLFPGEPIRYHPLFYIAVGLLERSGLRLDWAMNIPSALGFFLVLHFLIRLGKNFYSSTVTGLLAVLFFLFNGSLSYIKFFKLHPLSTRTLSEIAANSRFPNFGPWDGGQITAFWNLNIFTNQRHLAPSFALALLLIWILFTGNRKLTYFSGFILGVFLLLNHAVFAICLLFVAWFFLARPRLRLPLIYSMFGFLPGFSLFRYTVHITPSLFIKTGFLTPQPVTWISWITFWFYNFGLHAVLIPLGFIFSPRRVKALAIPLVILFIIPNIWQFSPDMINNHKFFNFFLLFGFLFSAHFIITLFRTGWVGKIITPALLIFLVMGGIVDFFPVKNDQKLLLSDIGSDPDVAFFYTSTSPRDVVLNSTWLYHPASLAGRPIFNGYSYFTWSYGYDQVTRERQTQSVYSAVSKTEACRLLHRYGIAYVELNRHPEGFLSPNWDLWSTVFIPVYQNPDSGIRVFSVNRNCPLS
ncbi:MAG: hypothetical protein UX91_C0001G0055 [Candidatus Amesbacteria bacterium GW2011_GWB1_47_19]|nr:MAG: hypothetical protein UW51_C0001G0055 [Candidatus Amesbacteria bacterium GW2011_GWA1_44_24]KKU32067.1 MAG: hypothetical protein UX46_C0001G0054 [Candidatus Amesbacteria bacterium GW2011_GWC1_46_24]KKU67751.1 MAG: hypothetical protein UX91_C0001G0055 [Candidatus Amesbacteria bacterium GW2011_GWB1_47_19]OGD06064.1 MAG: hypothetical protein A2379_03150 [Candidatus Amesbacteria bacterium RIFOXYB1_FULL_47_13]HBC72346.1 hypothetical protein [Candidatus Amesbacteria bacterium]